MNMMRFSFCVLSAAGAITLAGCHNLAPLPPIPPLPDVVTNVIPDVIIPPAPAPGPDAGRWCQCDLSLPVVPVPAEHVGGETAYEESRRFPDIRIVANDGKAVRGMKDRFVCNLYLRNNGIEPLGDHRYRARCLTVDGYQYHIAGYVPETTANALVPTNVATYTERTLRFYPVCSRAAAGGN